MNTSLLINCGYARVGIKELCNLHPGQKRSDLDFDDIQRRFGEEFNIPSFGVPDELFNQRSNTQFQLKCMNILDVFSKNWNDKKQYIEVFTQSNWKQLSSTQASFPLHPR